MSTVEDRLSALESTVPAGPPDGLDDAGRKKQLVALIEEQRESVQIAELNQEVVEYFAALEAEPIAGLESIFADAAVTAAQILDPKSPAGKDAQKALAQANRLLLTQARARTRAGEAAQANRAVTVDAARARLKDYEEQLAALGGDK